MSDRDNKVYLVNCHCNCGHTIVQVDAGKNSLRNFVSNTSQRGNKMKFNIDPDNYLIVSEDGNIVFRDCGTNREGYLLLGLNWKGTDIAIYVKEKQIKYDKEAKVSTIRWEIESIGPTASGHEGKGELRRTTEFARYDFKGREDEFEEIRNLLADALCAFDGTFGLVSFSTEVVEITGYNFKRQCK